MGKEAAIPGKPLEATIAFRVFEEFKEETERCAKLAKCPSCSDYLRDAIHEKNQRTKKESA